MNMEKQLAENPKERFVSNLKCESCHKEIKARDLGSYDNSGLCLKCERDEANYVRALRLPQEGWIA
jgi:hypothetical protein